MHAVQWRGNIDGQSAVSTISHQSDGGHRCGSTINWYMNTAHYMLGGMHIYSVAHILPTTFTIHTERYGGGT